MTVRPVFTIKPEVFRHDNENNIERLQRIVEQKGYIRLNLAKFVSESEMMSYCKLFDHIDISRLIVDLPYPGVKNRIILPDCNRVEIKKEEHFLIYFDLNNKKIKEKKLAGYLVPSIGKKMWESIEKKKVYYGSGEGAFYLNKVSNEYVDLIAANDFTIYSTKALIVSDCVLKSENQKEIIRLVEHYSPYAWALSFSENVKDIEAIFKWKKKESKIICKIETEKGVENANKLLSVSDGLMIARGDLFLNYEKLDIISCQEELSKICKNKNKELYIATDVLESLKSRYIPSRADMSDLIQILQLKPNGIVFEFDLYKLQKEQRCIELITKRINRIRSVTDE